MAVTRREAREVELRRVASLPVAAPAAGRRARTEQRGKVAGIPPFQAFLEEHRSLVYRFLIGTVGPDEADDCFQETFLAALRGYPKLRNGDNLRGWILAIATRKAIDAARTRNRQAAPVADIAGLDAAQAAQGWEVELEAFGGSIDEPMWSEILELPPMQRIALVHRILLDRPYAELAAAMGCSVDSARANVYQALKKLREAWTNREGR